MKPETYKADPEEARRWALRTAPSIHNYSSPEAVQRLHGFLATARALGLPRPVALAAVVGKNRTRLDSDSLMQRHWQTRTRRESRARNWDSVYIREEYVRCNPTNYWPPITRPLADRKEG